MKKILFFACLMVPLFFANAQTFRRKTQQPGFFMPQSALSNGQQQERLPAIESMNYQGKRPGNYNARQNVQSAQKQNQVAPVVNNEIEKQAQIQPKTVQKSATPKVAAKTQNEIENVSVQKTEPVQKQAQNKEKSADAYQQTFAQILNRHKGDLMRISQGDYTESRDISDLAESFKSETKTVRDTVYPRSIIVQ